MNVVIYARYSSHSQTEQSIEGQLHTCYEYARNNGYLVVGEYIDRAQSGTTDSRAEFQRMIADSDKHTFEGVLVYQLDRFARNRYDSAINKAKLKKNGVRVISARENISDDASGILVEGVLESMAEYYSAELSQKIRRGMDINAEKCLSNGSNPGLGYRVDEERRFHIDPEGAAVVREIFEQYASGKTVTEIIQSLNARQIKTSQGKAFNKNSLHRLLRNRRYIGYYIYKGVETPNGMPRILEDELFERVQHILDRNKKAPARARGREEYLLTTKLFCGYCREMMTGYGGTGKSGKAYHYYACNNFKRRKCKKKVISKEKIENRVVLECRKLLTDSNIEHIAASVAAVCESDRDTVSIKRIKAAIQEADTAIENLWKALEKGQAADMITERIEKRQKEKEELQAQLAIEMNKQVRLSAADIRAYLYALKYGDKNDENTKRGIINIFLRAVYLFNETFTLILNGSDKPIVIDDILLDEIEEGLDNDLANHNLCSSLVADAPPIKNLAVSTAAGFFLYLQGLSGLPVCALLAIFASYLPLKHGFCRCLYRTFLVAWTIYSSVCGVSSSSPIIYGGTFSFLFPLYVLGCLSCGPSSPSTIACLIVRISPSRQSHVRPLISDVRRPSQTARRKGNSKSVPLQSVTASLTRTSVCSLPSFFLSSPKR